MRLVTYQPKKKGAAPRVGVMFNDTHLMDVKVADMVSLIAMGAKGKARISVL